jgi:Predicted Zn-dependent protease (DUF2268)
VPCVLHLLNADGVLDDWLGRIEHAFDTALPLISERIPVGDVDVVVYNDAEHVVPELGVSGFCTSARRMYLPIDVRHPELQQHFELRFRGFLAHELHHCARRRVQGDVQTLAEALVTEGLACCFEAEMPGGSVPMYALRVQGQELQRAWQLAQPCLNLPMQGWGEWFFGEAEPRIPRHAGYSMGHERVAAWLRRNRTTAARAYAVSAAEVMADA